MTLHCTPRALKMTIIHSSVIKNHTFHPCPKTSKKAAKCHPKSTTNRLNAAPDACVKRVKKTLLKRAATWAPRVPKVSPKMSTKSSKIRSRAPLDHRSSPGVSIYGFWLHFGTIFAQLLMELGLDLAKSLVGFCVHHWTFSH